MIYTLAEATTHRSPFRAGPLPMTGFDYGYNSPVSPGFTDDMDHSDIRGHALDATVWVPGGGVQSLGTTRRPNGLISQVIAWRPGR